MNWGIGLSSVAAVGIGSLLAWLLLAMGDVLQRLGRFRVLNPAQMFLTRENPGRQFTQDDLYGLGHIPWTLWRLIGALFGVALSYLLLAERNPALSILGLAGAFAPRLIRAYLVRRRKVDVDRQVRDFIFLLRPALALHGGLRPALEMVAERLEPGVVRDRLHHHLERSFAGDPTAVIQGLAHDLDSAELNDLLLGVTAARKGGLSFNDAVVGSADAAAERMDEQAHIAIEETPMRLLIPMLILLTPPFLVLSLYPLLARLLALLSSPAGGMMGGW